MKYKLTKSQRVDALDWILDCCVTEDEANRARELSDTEIEYWVDRRFENGTTGFLASYNT